MTDENQDRAPPAPDWFKEIANHVCELYERTAGPIAYEMKLDRDKEWVGIFSPMPVRMPDGVVIRSVNTTIMVGALLAKLFAPPTHVCFALMGNHPTVHVYGMLRHRSDYVSIYLRVTVPDDADIVDATDEDEDEESEEAHTPIDPKTSN